MSDWKETTLWKQLKAARGPEAVAARALLDQEMPGIQTILTQAHTAPTDFTLHDADHSFRVAKWMAEIIPGDVLKQLSPYEITLLLLAAYLHDIGMTPEQGRVDRFWYHLVYGAPDPKIPRQPLTEEEARNLQGWLDDDGRDLTIPLAPGGAASEETKRLADLLIAHYCRHRHNDWSGDWISAHLGTKSLPGYETWVDDLIQLCRSHHEGYDELKQGRFDPRPAGLSGQPVHHRYLACVLRVADVLEIDPERTPEVIFRHREIHPGSVLYWRKDHENWILRDGNSLVLTAYPDSAVIENAIRRTAEGIQQELSMCVRLDREQPFSRWKLLRTKELPHRWNFPEVLTVHVQPRNDAYVYIDGAFRPNTEKLLELLSGTQLYGNPLVAVRELLQNAFDAVKEEMAYQRLERPNDPEFAKHLAGTHRVELRLEERDGRQWLVCKDTGVGMTRRIIENYLLVSGNSRRREIAELERRCQSAGFRLGRTGQFGIGVLSYFMLADRVEIRTRRSAARADTEVTGWAFFTEGVGSFGELKKELSAVPGTEVRLRLRQGVKLEHCNEWHKGKAFEQELRNYLDHIVRHIPCTLEFREFDKAREPIFWKSGWIHSLEEFASKIVDNVPFPHFKRKKSGKIKNDFQDRQNVVREALRWRTEIGELPQGLGTYRISVPFFELAGGRCDIFMFVRSEGKHGIVSLMKDRTVGTFSPSELVQSIHGMMLETFRSFTAFEGFGFKEINWESSKAGSLSVDRKSLDASLLAKEAVKWVGARACEILTKALTEEPSEYAVLNGFRLLGLGKEQYCWALGNPEREVELVWKSVSFPVALAHDFPGQERDLSFRGKSLSVLFSLQFGPGLLTRLPPIFQTSPDKVVARRQRSFRFGVARLWENAPEVHRQCSLGSISQFPPEWRGVCGVDFGDEIIWNVGHPLISTIDEDSVRWLELTQGWLGGILNLAALGDDILASPARAARVLIWVLSVIDKVDAWSALLEKDQLLAKKLLRLAFKSSGAVEKASSIGILKLNGSKQWRLIVLTSESVAIIKPGQDSFEEFLPPPGPDWVITQAAASDDEPT